MRVAFVARRTAQHEATGATNRTRRVAEHLARRGHDVTVVCAQWWEGDVAAFEHERVTYRRVCTNGSALEFARRAPFALREVDPEVIHARAHPPEGVVAARVTGSLFRIPVVVDWWPDPSGERAGPLPRGRHLAARIPQLVLTPSELAKTTVREYGARAEDVRVIPESIDFSLVEEAPVDDRADVVYARTLDGDANVDSFLLALAELRDREWRAAVVGDGPARSAAEQTAAELRIADRVSFLGDLPDAERVSVLKGAHVFAQTAERETFATDLLWALACGCVSIVEYQADSSAHELVEGSDRHDLVTSPQELADRIVDAAGLDRRAVDDAYASYDHDAVLERYLSCYREVMTDYGVL